MSSGRSLTTIARGITTTQISTPIPRKAARHPNSLITTAAKGAQMSPPSPAPRESTARARESLRLNHLAITVKAGR